MQCNVTEQIELDEPNKNQKMQESGFTYDTYYLPRVLQLICKQMQTDAGSNERKSKQMRSIQK